MPALTGPTHGADLATVCTVLANAFLAAETWTEQDLRRAGARVLAGQPRLVATAATVALHGFRAAPADAPREFATALRASSRLRETYAVLAARGPIRVTGMLVAPTVAREPLGALPRIDTVTDLARLLGVTAAHLDWMADTRGWNRRAQPGPLHHYRYAWLPRAGRTPRLLEMPLHLTLTAQRRVLDEILVHLPLHDAAHGFVRGRSALTGAERHIGREIVVNADLVSFFSAVTPGRIFGVLRRAGLPESVAHTLTGLCTHAVPEYVIASMPPGGAPEERHALRSLLARPHLPQGAPSSPALANLSLRRLDQRLTGWAEALEAIYTRYADDLAFSGGPRLAARPDAFLRGVDRIVRGEGHRLNARKSRVRRRGTRQQVTGIVVNDHPAVGRRETDALRALLHNCIRSGPASQNRAGHDDFRAHLDGRIGWIEQVHPDRGARLRAQFERIDWAATGAGTTG